jgi:hypothetical protein
MVRTRATKVAASMSVSRHKKPLRHGHGISNTPDAHQIL